MNLLFCNQFGDPWAFKYIQLWRVGCSYTRGLGNKDFAWKQGVGFEKHQGKAEFAEVNSAKYSVSCLPKVWLLHIHSLPTPSRPQIKLLTQFTRCPRHLPCLLHPEARNIWPSLRAEMPLDCGDTIFTFHLADCEALQFAGFRLERLFLAGSTELVTRCLYIYRLADKSRAVSGNSVFIGRNCVWITAE